MPQLTNRPLPSGQDPSAICAGILSRTGSLAFLCVLRHHRPRVLCSKAGFSQCRTPLCRVWLSASTPQFTPS